jgi:hypothetical protein
VIAILLWRSSKRVKGWVLVQATVVEKVNDGLEGSGYDLRVIYEFGGETYTEVAQNWFFVDRKKRIGDVIKILLNPRNPHICVLYY